MSKKSKVTPPPAPSPSVSPAKVMAWTFPWRAMGVILVVQFVWLGLAAKNNLDQLNNDAIAYLRLGEYYAQGKMDLAVSGYWGPMLSWLIALGIKLGFAPMAAGRAAMVISSLVFTAGAIGLLRGVRLSGWPAILSAAIAAISTIFWSVEYLSPDLLVSGLMLGAWGVFFTGSWLKERKWQAAAGALWGLAYLAKAVAFPLAVVVTLAVAGLRLLIGGERKQVLLAATITVSVFALVASPWVGTLSAKYGHFTFSTSGRINHSIVGPEDVDRYHPVFRTFHQPEAGRVTQWEDPSRMDYKSWSPLANLSHQVTLLRKNFNTVIAHLVNFDLLFVGIISLLAAAFVTAPWREKLAAERWRWTLLPLGCLCGIYLPVWVAPFDERYFYAALPVLLITSFGTVTWLRRVLDEQAWVTTIGGGLIVLVFGFYPLLKASFAPQGLRHDTTVMARTMADTLRQQNLSGPIAGSGTVLGNRTGLFTAYLLGTPWLGDRKEATFADFQSSGAQIIIIGLNEPAAGQFLQDSGWQRFAIQFPKFNGMEGEVPLAVMVKKSSSKAL
ncbi:MAG: hypothetical protein ACO1QS_13690 [Verrucomicrobiota bacterium]